MAPFPAVVPPEKAVALELTECLDQKLSLPRRVRLIVHLAICGECRRLKRQFVILKEAARLAGGAEVGLRDPDLAMSPAFQMRLEQAVKEWQDDAERGA